MPTFIPASAAGTSLRKACVPVTTTSRGLACSSSSPTISTLSPMRMDPRLTRPVQTVPRPEMVTTSSTGMRNGEALSRSGTGMWVSMASTSAFTPATHGLSQSPV